MGIGTSLFLIAAGAILNYGIEVENTEGVNLNTIGVILMVVGVLGVLLSLAFWNSWGGFGGRRTTVVDDAPVSRRRVYEDEVI